MSNYSIDAIVWLANEERKNRSSSLTIDEVFQDVCLIFDQSPVMVKSKSRERKYLFCRYIVGYVSYLLCRATLKEIGRYFGGKDHTTILAANQKVKDWIKVNDPDFMLAWTTYTESSEIWKLFNPKKH
jgi:chromosomal replication initiation ATPase DnaA